MPTSLFPSLESEALGKPAAASNDRLRRVASSPRTWGMLLVCMAALATHFPVIRAEFLLFDDPDAVTENSQVLRGLSWETIHWAFTTNHFSNWMPATWLSLMLDTELFGTGPGGYHTTNLVLHVLSSAVLLLVLYRLSDKTLPCVFTAALFAVHPINVQAVAWIAERKGLLSSFFWLLGLLAYTYYAAKPCFRRYLLVSICLVLSLMSKQMAVTFGAGLLLLDYWPLNRLFVERDGTWLLQRKVVIEKVPWFAIGIVFIAIGYVAQDSSGALGDTTQYPLGMRLRYATVGFIEYLRKAAFPIDLQFHYHNYGDGPSNAAFLISLAALLCLIGLATRCRRQYPAFFVGFWWFAVTLLPVCGLLQIGQQRLADRYVYMPLIGIYGLVAAGLFSKSFVSLLGQRICVVFAVLLTILLGIKANSEAKYWHDDVSLYERALKLDPRNPNALVNLGNAKKKQGEVDRAKALYEAAILNNANDSNAHHNLGRIYSDRGGSEAAIKHYKTAIASARNFPAATNSLGIEYLKTGEFGLAQPLFEQNLHGSPDSDIANGNLATCHFRQGKFSTAEGFYRQAVTLSPLNASWHFQLARSLALMERWAEAEAEFLATRSLSPRVGDAISGCAMAQAHQGKFQAAMSSLRDLATLDGGAKDTLLQTAFLIMTSREKLPGENEAVQSILNATSAGPSSTGPSSGWGLLVESMVKSEAGDFLVATELATQAMANASTPDNFELIDECKRAIVAFKQGKPYRLGPEK